MKKFLILTTVWAMTAAAIGQTFTTNVAANIAIPDNNASGLVSPVTIGGLSGTIGSVTVTLDISGGFNGDLYAYLVGPNGGFAVLLNRAGVSDSASAFGYGDAGFNVTLTDTAANGNIHYYQNVLNPVGGQLTGTWQPDGANINPQSAPAAFLSAGQTAMLSSFIGTDANGQWVIFFGDLSAGGQSTLVSWDLNITMVPEPSTLALLGTGIMGLAFAIRRRNAS